MSLNLKEIEIKAENGDVNSQKFLANTYEMGLEEPASPEKALYWWVKACGAGDEQALHNLANFLYKHKGLSDSPLISDAVRNRLDLSPISSVHDLVLMAKADVNKVAKDKTPKILLVDENTDSIKLTKFQVERHGWKCLEAESVKSANRKCLGENINAIICDKLVTETSLAPVIKKFRSILHKKGIKPHIYITAKGVSREDLLELKDLQISGLFLRPFDEEKFAKALEALRRTIPLNKKSA